MNVKRSLLVGAAVATVAVGGLGGVGLAATNNSSGDGSTIVDKIASKFNLNKTEVQAVFDQNREEHKAEREAKQKAKLEQAVKDGKLTQAQADHITQVRNEIKALKGDSKPSELSDSVRDQIESKMEALRDWADDNNIDKKYVMGHGGHRGGHGEGREGPGGMRGEAPDDSTESNS